MTKKDLLQYRSAVADALAERMASGDFDANSQHMRLLLGAMLEVLNNAIEKPDKK